VSGVDFLLAVLALLTILLVARRPDPGVSQCLAGRTPRVLSPPPRSLLAAI
jgi:hypothetical protein